MINFTRCRPGLVFTTMITLLLLVSLLPCKSEAAEEYFLFLPKDRIEVSTSFDRLSPNAVYGDWKNLSVSYYHRATPDLTWYASANSFARQEGNGILGAVGAYKNWGDSFFTFTSLSGGSDRSYLPKTRVDQDLNFKIGAKKNLVWTVGGTYLQYYGDNRDYIWSTGLSAYFDRAIITYRFFKDRSDPGSVMSNSQVFSYSYGQDKHDISTLTYSVGNQAYLANYQTLPQVVDSNSRRIALQHRHWVTAKEGYTVDVSRSFLYGGYSTSGIALGYFWEH